MTLIVLGLPNPSTECRLKFFYQCKTWREFDCQKVTKTSSKPAQQGHEDHQSTLLLRRTQRTPRYRLCSSGQTSDTTARVLVHVGHSLPNRDLEIAIHQSDNKNTLSSHRQVINVLGSFKSTISNFVLKNTFYMMSLNV